MPSIVLAALLALLAAASPAGAATYYVRAGGDDAHDGLTPATALASIRLAATRLSAPGDLLVVGPGTYVEGNIEPLASGTPDAPIVLYADRDGALTGDPAGPVTILPPNTIDATTGFIVFGRHDLVIEGFTVRGAADAGVQIRPRRALPIDSSRIVVRDMMISDGQRRGIDVRAVGDVAVLDNMVRNHGGAGIAIAGGEGGAARPHVQGNVSEANEAALSLEQTFAAEVRDNALHDGRIGLLVVDSRGVTASDNELVGSDRGLTLWMVDGATVTGNAIFRKGEIRSSGALRLAANTFSDDFNAELTIRADGAVSLLGNALPRTDLYTAGAVELAGNTSQRLRVSGDAVAVRDSRIGGSGLYVRAAGALEIRHVDALALDAFGETVVAIGNTIAGRAWLSGRVAEVAGNTAAGLAVAWRTEAADDGAPGSGAVIVRDNTIAGALRVGASNMAIPAGTVAANLVGGRLRVFAIGPLAVVDNRAAHLSALLDGPDTPVRVAGNTVRDSDDTGLLVRGASDAVIEDNLATGHAGTGLAVRSVGALTVRSNVFTDNDEGGISVLAPPLASDCNGDVRVSIADLITIVGVLLGERPLADCPGAERTGDGAVGIADAVAAVAAALGAEEPDQAGGPLRLEANRVEDNGRRGIDVEARGPVTASGNRVLGNGGIALSIRLQDSRHAVDVTGNVLGGGTAEGLRVEESAAVRIAGNRVFSHRDDGIVLSATPDALVLSNLVYANGNDAIAIGSGGNRAAPGTRVRNNTLYGNQGWGVTIGNPQEPSPDVALLDNIITENRAGGIAAIASSLGGLTIGFNLVTDGYGTDVVPSVTDFVADPRFQDPDGIDDLLGGSGWADDDFRLRPTSAAIDAGSATATELGVSGSAVAGLDGDPGIVDLGFHYPDLQ